MEPELSGPGLLSKPGPQVGQSAGSSLGPQGAPLHKTASMSTKPPCGHEGCVYLIRGSARGHSLRLHGAGPSKEVQMVSTQEETSREKEGCIPRAQDSIRCGLDLHRAQIGQNTQMEPMEDERRSPWRHRWSQHQGLRLFRAMQTATAWTTVLQRTDGWSVCGQGSARRQRSCHLWMWLPWAHGSACWCRRRGQRCAKPQWRDMCAR